MNDDEPHLMSVHAVHLVELVARFGVTADELLAPLGLDVQTLADPQGRLPLAQVTAVVTRAVELTGEAGLGVYMGLAMRASWHGYLGLASMLARDVRQALELMVAFVPTRTNTLSFRLLEEGDTAAVVVVEEAEFGAARLVLIPAIVLGLAEIARTLTGQKLSGRADFCFSEPPWFSRFQALRPGEEIRFSQPEHRLVFPRSHLDAPFTLADPLAQKLALEHCERELQALGFAGRLAGRVRSRLLRAAGDGAEVVDVADVARGLGLSERTLKRRLSEEGTSYSALLDEERHKRSLLLLQNPALSLEQVAARLGYADPVAFSRAFSRWTGTTPAKHRRNV